MDSFLPILQAGNFQLCVSLDGGEPACFSLSTNGAVQLRFLSVGCHRVMAWWEDLVSGTTGMSAAVVFEVANQDGQCVNGGCEQASLVCKSNVCTTYHVAMPEEPSDLVNKAPAIRMISPLEGDTVSTGGVLFAVQIFSEELSAEIRKGVLQVCYHFYQTYTVSRFTLHVPRLDTCVNHMDPYFAILPAANFSVQVTVESSVEDVKTEIVSTEKIMFIVSEDIDQASYRRREGFRLIYMGGHWGAMGGRSGPGSEIKASESDRLAILNTLIDTNSSSLFDAGCGSLNWQPLLFQDYARLMGRSLKYHGADIVSVLIDKHSKAYSATNSTDPQEISFSTADIVQDPIPMGFEVILVRHVFFHNTIQAIKDALRNLSSSGALYLLATTLRVKSGVLGLPDLVNAEIEIGTDGRRLDLGGYRPICLEAPPFNLSAPLQFYNENYELPEALQNFEQGLALWRLPLTYL